MRGPRARALTKPGRRFVRRTALHDTSSMADEDLEAKGRPSEGAFESATEDEQVRRSPRGSGQTELQTPASKNKLGIMGIAIFGAVTQSIMVLDDSGCFFISPFGLTNEQAEGLLLAQDKAGGCELERG